MEYVWTDVTVNVANAAKTVKPLPTINQLIRCNIHGLGLLNLEWLLIITLLHRQEWVSHHHSGIKISINYVFEASASITVLLREWHLYCHAMTMAVVYIKAYGQSKFSVLTQIWVVNLGQIKK